MADFVAVLRKTIDGLADPTPELRQRVYAKARATIEQKLVALNASEAVAARQTQALDDAIAEVESSFAPPPPATAAPEPVEPPPAPAESQQGPQPEPQPETVAPQPQPRPLPPTPVAPPSFVAPAPSSVPEPAPSSEMSELLRAEKGETGYEFDREDVPVEAAPTSYTPSNYTPVQSQPDALEDFLTGQRQADKRDEPQEDQPVSTGPQWQDDLADHRVEGEPAIAADGEDRSDYGVYTRKPLKHPTQRRSLTPIIAAAVVLIALAGLGYAGYVWRDSLVERAGAARDYLASLTSSSDEGGQQPPAAPADQQASQEPQPATPGQPAPTNEASPAPATPEPQAEPKLTQRLLPDGQEVDPGRANDTPSLGEGTSVATSTPDQPAAPNEPNAQAPAALPIGQKAFFYEERSGQDAGTAESGGVVWSVVQESPGNDLPPEPAIKAEVTVPERGINLRMIIRRNGDKTLPASHLIEMIFTVPEGFAGGAIETVSRMTFKDTEQAPGSPLVAIPAKIADNFFIIAMNDAKTAIDTNMSLMRRQSWIDIPIAYKTGRRALITLEKGLPGEKAFEEVLRSWAAKSAGTQ